LTALLESKVNFKETPYKRVFNTYSPEKKAPTEVNFEVETPLPTVTPMPSVTPSGTILESTGSLEKKIVFSSY
jgi:hypothetical protein